MPNEKKPSTISILSNLPFVRWITKPKAFAMGFVLALLLVGGIALFNAGRNTAAPKASSPSPSTVFARVQQQDRLVCATQDYSIVDKVDNGSSKIPFTDIDIPFTQSSFWARYCGTLECTVELSTAEFSQDGNKLTVTLDQPEITANTPDMDKTGILEENGNFLNPLHLDLVTEFEKASKERSEQEAKDGGIIEEAKENAADNLKRLFDGALGNEYELEVQFRDTTE